jgi:hypothetical protein
MVNYIMDLLLKAATLAVLLHQLLNAGVARMPPCPCRQRVADVSKFEGLTLPIAAAVATEPVTMPVPMARDPMRATSASAIDLDDVR